MSELNVIPYLKLNYTEWTRFVKENWNKMTGQQQEWVRAWDAWDLACSPMDDKNRSLIRYGHHLGFTSRTRSSHQLLCDSCIEFDTCTRVGRREKTGCACRKAK